MLSLLLVEDDAVLRFALERLLRTRCPHIRLLASVADYATAHAVLQQHTPDLLLSDVMLPGGSLIDLLATLPAHNTPRYTPFVIAVSAAEHHRNALVARFSCTFLAKPLDNDELVAVLNRACEQLAQQQTLAMAELLLPCLRQTLTPNHLPAPQRLVCIEGEGDYSRLFFADGTTELQTIRLGEFPLTPHLRRVHKSFVVNMLHVTAWHERGKEATVVLSNGTACTVSRTYKRAAFEHWQVLQDLIRGTDGMHGIHTIKLNQP